VVLQQNTPVAAPMQNTDPCHSAWGPRLSHRPGILIAQLKSFCKEQIIDRRV
jgi:hypothetical protein